MFFEITDYINMSHFIKLGICEKKKEKGTQRN